MRSTRHIAWLICLGWLTASDAKGQQLVTWGAFSQRVDVSSHRGKKFELTAAVRVLTEDEEAKAQLWARVDLPDKKVGFFDNMNNRPVRNKEWNSYSIRGEIDKTGEFLVFGGLFFFNGDFYFDDFHLKIETTKNSWSEISLANSDFEMQSDERWPPGWSGNRQSEFFNPRLAANLNSGKQCLLIEGRNVIAYGNNAKAGKIKQVNGITIYYEEYGSGEPLLLLHGNSSSIQSFYAQIPELARQFRVIAMDSRMQGQSTGSDERLTYDLMANDAAALLDQLMLDSVLVLGWSDGGNIGLSLAIHHPKKVKKLAVMGANLRSDERAVYPEVLNEVKSMLQEKSISKELRRLTELLLTEPNMKNTDLKVVSIPVLVMAGDYDMIREEHTIEIFQSLTKSQLCIFPGATHHIPWENPPLFNSTVVNFFKKPFVKPKRF
jgi:pimeloyl-ACP methyl ester carboxylesterase